MVRISCFPMLWKPSASYETRHSAIYSKAVLPVSDRGLALKKPGASWRLVEKKDDPFDGVAFFYFYMAKRRKRPIVSFERTPPGPDLTCLRTTPGQSGDSGTGIQ